MERFVCMKCSAPMKDWRGTCPHCGQWNSVEEVWSAESQKETWTGAKARAIIESHLAKWEPVDVAETEHDVVQRALKESNRARLVNDMRAGRYLFNGQSTIVLSIQADGSVRVLNGWHTLNADADADVNIEVLTTRFTGLTFEQENILFATMDSGIARSFADIARISLPHLARKDANRIAAVTMLAYKGQVLKSIKPNGKEYPTKATELAFLAANPNIAASCVAVARLMGKMFRGGTLTVASVMHYLIGYSFPDSLTQRDLFFEKLTSGVGLRQGEPVQVLRDVLLKDQMSKKRSHDATTEQKCAFFIKTWNAQYTGGTIKQLREQRKRETFPVLDSDAKFCLLYTTPSPRD
jgi:hypothetical protein